MKGFGFDAVLKRNANRTRRDSAMKTHLNHLTSVVRATGALVFICSATEQRGTAASVNTGPLSTVRTEHTMTLLPNGKVLVVAGRKPGGGFFSSCELYDPASGTWSSTGSLNSEVEDQRATLLLNGKLLITGGYGKEGPRSVAERYDPDAGTWTVTGPMNSARADHTATLLRDGRVLVAGGLGSGNNIRNPLSSAEIYSPASGKWTSTGSLNFGRSSHKASLLPDGRVLVAGGAGEDAISLASAELYDPATGTWTMTSPMNVARTDHKPLLLPGGKVMVLGGFNDAGPLSSVELYNPTIGKWAATGNMIQSRLWNSVTLLPSGKVLVIGGASRCDGNHCVLASTELYDPATEKWTAAGTLITARVIDHVALLLNVKVLVAGGYNLSGRLVSSELFEPDAGPAPSPASGTTLPVSILSAGGTAALGANNVSPMTKSVEPVGVRVTEIILTDSARLPNGSFQFTFTNTPGLSFTVFGTTNLAEPVESWQARGGPVEILPGRYQFTDPHATNSVHWFYRVRSP